MCKYGAWSKEEVALLRIEDDGSRDVRRKHVRGELNSPKGRLDEGIKLELTRLDGLAERFSEHANSDGRSTFLEKRLRGEEQDTHVASQRPDPLLTSPDCRASE